MPQLPDIATAPSVLSADFLHLGRAVAVVLDAGALPTSIS